MTKYTEQEVRYMAYECGKVFGTDWSIAQMLTAYADLLAAQPVAVPDGYKLVPVIPTSEMRKAAADAWFDCDSKLFLNKANAAVRAGIEAAKDPK